MSVHVREILLDVVHAHFESLIASWLHGQHDPEHEMLVVCTEETGTSYSCHGEFWPLEDIDEGLYHIQEDADIIRHDLFMQGLERALPMLILAPGTVLPVHPPLEVSRTANHPIAEIGDEP